MTTGTVPLDDGCSLRRAARRLCVTRDVWWSSRRKTRQRVNGRAGAALERNGLPQGRLFCLVREQQPRQRGLSIKRPGARPASGAAATERGRPATRLRPHAVVSCQFTSHAQTRGGPSRRNTSIHFLPHACAHHPRAIPSTLQASKPRPIYRGCFRRRAVPPPTDDQAGTLLLRMDRDGHWASSAE